MRIKRVAVGYTLFMLAFLFLFLRLFNRATLEKRDIVRYNDLLYQVTSDISDGRPIPEIERDYDCRIVLSKALEDPELAALYAEEAFVLDLVIDGEYAGKVAWLDRQERKNSYGRDFLTAALLFWGVTFLLGHIMFLVVYLWYIRPVDDLKKYSEELARGNLDTPLPIRRTNLFGGFSEAFDIMREELKASQKRQREAEIARREMVGSLSHDVKTPVAVIDATCEVSEVKLKRRLERLRAAAENAGSERAGRGDISLRDTIHEDIAEVEDSLEKIAVISSKAGTIQTLISELLHSNLEGTEEAEVRPQEEYASLIEEYLLRNRSYGKVTVENHIAKCLVYMDRKRMEQVIDNIISNSVKYAGTGIRVFFDEVNDMLMPDGETGSFIRIRISDSGPGVAEEDLPLITQRYYRGKNAGEKSGYGMGLYLVRQYMIRQGGDMEYYNDNGFTVVLMLKKV